VKAFLCDGSTCNNLDASTKYYFANAFDTSAGGTYFTSDSSGYGPNDAANWSSANRFGGTDYGIRYWTGRASGTATNWGGTSNANTCNGWTSATSSYNGVDGSPVGNTPNSIRWAGFSDAAVKPALAVFDMATGLSDGLLGFVSKMTGGNVRPPPEFTNAESMREIRAQRQAALAMENIRDSIDAGQSLKAEDIRHLTPEHIENIKMRGDDFVRQMVADMERRRERDYGRLREE
jgi:hypothetical protein